MLPTCAKARALARGRALGKERKAHASASSSWNAPGFRGDGYSHSMASTYGPRCISCLLSLHLPMVQPPSRQAGRHRFDGLSSVEARTAGPLCRHRKALPSPVQIFVHSPSSLCPVSVQPHSLRYASPFHPRTTDPPTHPRWWEKGTRQEPSWLPSPSNLSSAWRPQRVDGINIARQATSWTSSFIPLFSSRRRYPSPP